MVVCKFFREGYCRFGSDCRFEHAYTSKYSYHAPAKSAPPTAAAPTVTTEKLIAQVSEDVRTALNGNQWLLTCYAPFSRKNFPGFVDVSPEEARLAVYEAKATDSIDRAVSDFHSLCLEANEKYRNLIQPNSALVETLRSVYKQENAENPFGTSIAKSPLFGGSSTATAASIFGSQNNAKSVFGGQSVAGVFGTQNNAANPQSVFGASSPQSVFGAQTNHASPQSVFGMQNITPSPQSVFGTSNSPASPQSVFGTQNSTPSPQSVFGTQTCAASPHSVFGTQSNTQSPQSVFGTLNTAASPQSVFGASQNGFFGGQSNSPTPQSVFGGQTNNSSVFASPAHSHAKVFGSPSEATSKPANVFQQNSPSPFSGATQTSVFGQSTSSQPAFGTSSVQDDIAVYSNIEELSAEDLEQFNSDSFEFGFIPELPPPRALCF